MADSKVRFGLKQAYYAIMKEDGTFDPPVRMIGAQSVNISNAGGDVQSIYGDDQALYTHSQGSSGKTLEVQFAKMGRDFLKDVCGMVVDETTGIVSESPDDKGKAFAFGYETTGDQGGIRCWVLENTATVPVYNAGTNNDSITEDPDTSTFTAVPHTCADNKQRVSCFCEAGDAAFADFFKAVPTFATPSKP